MILQICGNIIDTQYIYNISEPISRIRSNDDDWSYSLSVEFNILFLNNNSITIEKTGLGSFEYYDGNDLKNEKLCLLNELNNVRDQLICKWKANQLVIPKIEFDESNSIS